MRPCASRALTGVTFDDRWSRNTAHEHGKRGVKQSWLPPAWSSSRHTFEAAAPAPLPLQPAPFPAWQGGSCTAPVSKGCVEEIHGTLGPPPFFSLHVLGSRKTCCFPCEIPPTAVLSPRTCPPAQPVARPLQLPLQEASRDAVNRGHVTVTHRVASTPTHTNACTCMQRTHALPCAAPPAWYLRPPAPPPRAGHAASGP